MWHNLGPPVFSIFIIISQVGLSLFDACYLVCAILESVRKCFGVASQIQLLLYPHVLYPGVMISLTGSSFMIVAIAFERYAYKPDQTSTWLTLPDIECTLRNQEWVKVEPNVPWDQSLKGGVFLNTRRQRFVWAVKKVNWIEPFDFDVLYCVQYISTSGALFPSHTNGRKAT